MKYHRTVVEVEVLSEDEPWSGTLENLAYEIREGQHSGSVKTISSEEVTPKRMAELLQSQGSEPGFFQLDDNGNELETEMRCT